MTHHPVVQAAANGDLPPWIEAGDRRRAHMERVADLLDRWGEALGLSADERARWRALGYLHDALRGADPESLRGQVPPDLARLPGPLLHGPAAARRLWVDGVRDGAFLRAVAYHTLGHPGLCTMGRALYAADFLEPGRDLLNEWRAGLRERMPVDLDGVVREVLAARIRHLVDRSSHLRPETVAFWNAMAERP